MDFSKIRQAIDAAEKKADELNIKISTAIVDEHGDLLAFNRMEGALLSSPVFSMAKAYTAGTTGMATADFGAYVGEGKPLLGMQSLAGGKITSIPGGVPVKAGEKLVGAVGVGGSYDPNQDAECAKAAAEVLV